MILVFEFTWTGTYHAPGNSATIQAFSQGFPDQDIRVFADPSHLSELQRDEALTSRTRISFHSMPLSPQFRHRPHLVSIRRLTRELVTILSALRDVPQREPCLIMLISATSTAMFAASLVLRMSRRKLGVQVGLHGNLNDVQGWRPRNPLTRALDTHAAIMGAHPRRFRFLVLEDSIRDELARLAPAAAARTDVLTLPVNLGEIAQVPDTPLAAPVQIGFVGQATGPKGITAFLETARLFKARYGDRVGFHLVGRAMAGADLGPFAVLDSPVSSDHLPREEFLRRLASLHFVFSPYQHGYYNLSASGALLDAITWLKPIVATRMPVVTAMFERYGDIGYICDDLGGMQGVLDSVLRQMDVGRYRAQTDAMRRAREARYPEAVARAYRRIVAESYDGLLPAPDRNRCGA